MQTGAVGQTFDASDLVNLLLWYIHVALRPCSAADMPLIASSSVLGGPQLVHLLHTLLKLLILALFVGMSLVLQSRSAVLRVGLKFKCTGILRTSTGGRTPRTDTGSMGSKGARMSLGRAVAASQRSSPRG